MDMPFSIDVGTGVEGVLSLMNVKRSVEFLEDLSQHVFVCFNIELFFAELNMLQTADSIGRQKKPIARG